MREAIEDGRRDFKSRVRGLLVPGRYRSAGFTEAKYANKSNLPKRAQRDLIIHGAYEAVVDRDGRWTHRPARLLGLGLALLQRDPLGASRGCSGSSSRRR